MNTEELLAKAKDLVAKGDLSAAKQLVEDNKDALGKHLETAQNLLKGTDLNAVADKVKGLFGK